MKISTRSRYGTRILLELARQGGEGPVQVSQISRRQQIPAKYLEQLIRKLKAAGMVKSTRGVKGGHQLDKDPSDITVGQIVRLFDGQSDFVECITTKETKCEMVAHCPVRDIWKQASDAFYTTLEKITISDLLKKADAEGCNRPSAP